MLLSKKDHICGHSPEYVLKVAKEHIDAYQYDDMKILMATVSPRGGIWSGILPPTGAVIMRTTAEIEAAYTEALAAIRIGESIPSTTLVSDWYAVISGITKVSLKDTGQGMDTTSLGIFGADDKGLAIDTEIGMLLPPARLRPEGVSAAQQALSDYQAHEARMTAIATGDIDAAVQCVGEPTNLFLPVFDPDDTALQTHVDSAESYRDYLVNFHKRYQIEDTRVVNRCTTETWVFSERTWTLKGKPSGEQLVVRFAMVEALNVDGSVRSCIGIAING